MSTGTTPQRFAFGVDDVRLIGDLHFPLTKPKAVIVISGPFASIRQQATQEYASRLASRGFAALSFDHRTFGESTGEPRQCENPLAKVADIRAAASALGQVPGLSQLPMFAIGICAGAGYMAWAVVEEPRFAAYVGIAGYYPRVTYESLRHELPTLSRAMEAAETWSRSKINQTIPAVSNTGGDVAIPLPEAFEYYGTSRGMRPGYVNAVALQSRVFTLGFDALTAAEYIRVPTLLIHANNAIAPSLARNFAAQMREPPQTVWLHSLNQIDFYDSPELIDRACDIVEEFLLRVIAGRGR